MTAIEIARECGAEVWFKGSHMLFTESQLSTFVQRIKDEAYEEAAKACEEQRGTVSMFVTSRDAQNHGNGVTECVAAVRSLKGKP